MDSTNTQLKQNREELRLWEIRQRKTTPSSDRHRDPIIQFPVTSHGGGVNGPPDPYPLPSTEPPSECPAAINVDLDTEANSKTLTAVNRDSFTVSQVRCIVCSSTLHGGGRRKTSRRDSGPKRTAIYRGEIHRHCQTKPSHRRLSPYPDD